jgi:N-acyl-L-homoserine lactone synthetase
MKEIINKVIPVSLRVGYPETEEERNAMFQLRADVYKRKGYITAESDIDEYDTNNKCVYFIARINDRLVGTVRLVIDDPLPTELYFEFEKPEEIARIPRDKRGEISRLVSVARGMNHLVSLSLIEAIIKWANESDFLGGYTSIKANLEQILSSVGVPFHPISPATLKYNGDLLKDYFYKGDTVLPIYYLRDEAAEFIEKMGF